MTTRAATLADVTVPAIGDGQAARWVRAAILVAGGAALTALSAQIVWYAPWNPLVPYTFQTASVLLVGTVLGSRLGPASMFLYVALGAAGLGVFSGGSATIASVVRMFFAIEAAFCSADRVTIVGSMIPAFTRSSYSPVSTLSPCPFGDWRILSTTTEPSRPALSAS